MIINLNNRKQRFKIINEYSQRDKSKMKNEKSSVYIDDDNNVHIDISRPKCRKCQADLYGGEVDEGVCDSCHN